MILLQLDLLIQVIYLNKYICNIVSIIIIIIYNKLFFILFLIANLLKANFSAETLSDLHSSLNNIDRLRYLVAKTYKDIYPFGQELLGVICNIQTKQHELHDYVHTMSK